MCDELRVRAYAKVNFGLNVLPKRADGFHNLESIFQTVDLYDELTVRKTEGSGCIVHCKDMELPLENTLTLAYKAFCEVTGRNDFGLEVKLVKGIPSGGGLGGGSSDAASLIRCMENFTGLKLSGEQLSDVASKVGSDVFFFTRCNEKGTGCALVSGRGEIVEPIRGREDLILLLIFPKSASSTKLAYAMIDEMFEKGIEVKSPAFAELQSVYNTSPEKWNFINTFTPVITEAYPEIAAALEQVKNTGALYTEVSGSGSTVFGIFTSMQQAIYSCNLLADTWNCKVAKILCN